MEADFVIKLDEVTYKVFLDENAQPIARHIVQSMRSPFLTDTVLRFHYYNGAWRNMLRRINFVMTAELSMGRLTSLLFAEVNAESDENILHVVYTLRRYRRRGCLTRIIARFESILSQAGCSNIKLAPSSNVTANFFGKRAAASPLHYEIVLPSQAELDWGDEFIVND